MTSTFDRWEKDPFFSAAEEVQESADRMESTYRTWLHAIKNTSGGWNMDELRRDLQTTLGTAKWQLEEFGRAVRSSYPNTTSADDSKNRHKDFINAIEDQIKRVESSVNQSSPSRGKPPRRWGRLDEGERNELEQFLTGANRTLGRIHGKDQMSEGDNNECSRSSSHLVDLAHVEEKDDKFAGHRRTASASTADIGTWKIVVADEESAQDHSKPDPPPRKIPSFSAFLNTMESSISQLKWAKNGYKKLKLSDRPQEAGSLLPRPQNLTRGMNLSCEKSKSGIDGSDDYEKQLYGWCGTIQRQLQRSQYHMQYSRPVQIVFSSILLLCLLVLLVVRAI